MLKQVFEQLQGNQTPMTAASNVLPLLSNAVKQMMGQSRVYAKNGFLGFLFMKVYLMINEYFIYIYVFIIFIHVFIYLIVFTLFTNISNYLAVFYNMLNIILTGI